ncbi:hypothetical protein V491_02493 [Pseudogymnoascus sp. VKM F-3775]|nr:hypothetical protein V491_02493 [Pseudogymnoascus sp. VKM F-3775]
MRQSLYQPVTELDQSAQSTTQEQKGNNDPGALGLRTEDEKLEHVTSVVEARSHIVAKRGVAVMVRNSDGSNRP